VQNYFARVSQLFFQVLNNMELTAHGYEKITKLKLVPPEALSSRSGRCWQSLRRSPRLFSGLKERQLLKNYLPFSKRFLTPYSYAVSVSGTVVACMSSVCPSQMYCG